MFIRFLHRKCSCIPPPFFILYSFVYCSIFSEVFSFFLSMNIIILMIRENRSIFILEKKKDRVSSDLHPFFMCCCGLIFTLLHTAPPEVPAGSGLAAASVPAECDPDLGPRCWLCGACILQRNFRRSRLSDSINQPGALPSL